MQKSALVDESQDVWAAHLFFFPVHGPVVIHMLRNVGGRVVGGEEELLRLSTHQDEAQINHIRRDMTGHLAF